MKNSKGFILGIIITFVLLLGIGASTLNTYITTKQWPFGTAFYWADSSGWTVMSQSLHVVDSAFIGRDLTVLYRINLDSNKNINIYASGYNLQIENNKNNGGQNYYIGELNSGYSWYKISGASSIQLMQLDTITGLTSYYNIQTSGATTQIKMQGDTATDYDSDDAAALNRQSGRITTKSLTTAALTDYSITVNNSLCNDATIVIALVKSSSSTGTPQIRTANATTGLFIANIYNAHASVAFNNTVTFQYILINNP